MPLKGELVGRAYVELHADGSFVARDIRGAFKQADGDVKEAGDRHGKQYTDGFAGRMDALGDRIERIAERSGRAFGRGSRNNFLNFLGSAVANTSGLLALIPRLLSRVATMGSTMAGAFRDADGGLRGVVAAVGTLGPLLIKGGAALVAFAAALPAIVIMLAVFSSALTAIVGTLIALAGSVIYAAIAGIAALGGAAIVAAAGIGVIVAGIAGMSDAQKKMVKEATRPLVDAFKDLSAASARGLFNNIENQVRRLTPVLRAFEPLFFKIGRAVSRVGDSIVNSLDSPEFRHFQRQMEVFLPNSVRTLGEVVNNAFGGLGGVFLAMRPFIRNFLNDLEDITQQFSDWANSKKGREEIRDFLEDAAESAKSVGNFLLKVVDLFATLFEMGGKESGDSLFDSMADSIERFITYLEENPDAVRDFFEDAESLARQVGEVAVAVGDLVGELDDLLGHPILTGALDLLIGALDLVRAGFEKLPFVMSPLGFVLNNIDNAARDMGVRLLTTVGNARQFADKVRTAFSAIPGIVRGALKSVPKLVSAVFSGLGTFATRSAARLVSPFAPIVGNIMRNFASLRGRMRNTFDLGNIATNATRLLVNPFGNIVWRIMSNFADLRSRMKDRFDAAVDYVRDIPGRIAGLFAGLAGKILKAIGTIDIGSLIKIPDPGGGVPFIPGLAAGGIGGVTRGPMLRWVGEDGPEAIVPLNRDLSKVDPSVRALSAFAQGKGMASGGLSNARTVDASGWVIQSPGDPEAVAQEVINRLFATQF